MTREEIIEQFPIAVELRKRGYEIINKGKESLCICPFHEDKSPSLRINGDKKLWHCDPCNFGGSIIDLISRLDNISIGETLKRLGDTKPVVPIKPKVVAKYEYNNGNGEPIFRVLRYEPKTFKQQKRVGDKWEWGMEGVERVLYNLRHVMSSEEIWICEGEKDVDNLGKLGLVATCNVGGAGKWLRGYTDSLKGKDIIICPDNDKAGLEHAKLVFDELAGKVKSVRQIILPEGIKDASDYIVDMPEDDAYDNMMALRGESAVYHNGVNLPIHSVPEMEHKYEEFSQKTSNIDFGKWLPSLGKKNIRPLVPGELVVVISGTGVGKTAMLQNIADKLKPLNILTFEMELPVELMFERTAAIASGITCKEIDERYRAKRKINYPDSGHIFVCPQARLTTENIKDLIIKSELKIGARPDIVMVDYLQLISGAGTRYERFSTIAEDLKIMAKETNTLIIVSSQIGRKDDEEVFLQDGKETGSIENSAGMVLGAWRKSDDKSIMYIRVLKCTKGGEGLLIPCDFRGSTLQIQERME